MVDNFSNRCTPEVPIQQDRIMAIAHFDIWATRFSMKEAFKSFESRSPSMIIKSHIL